MGESGGRKPSGLSPPLWAGEGGKGCPQVTWSPSRFWGVRGLSIAEGQYCLPTNPWKGGHLLLIYPMAISHLFHKLEGETGAWGYLQDSQSPVTTL